MNIRSIIALVLALVAMLMINVSHVDAARVKTYTPEQIEQLQSYASDLAQIRDRMPELANLIQQQDWIYTRNFIHGPLGEIRVKMFGLTRNLLPDAQGSARQLSSNLFESLNAMDQAAQSKDYKAAIRSYAEVVRDLDTFLSLVPRG